jgi:signal transduction histidine kinase
MLKLLQAGSFESGIELAPVNVRKLLDAVEAQTSVFLAHRRQTLKITIEPPDAVLNLDRGKMHDVLVNLVMNAIKFSPDGSTIDLSVRAGSGQWAVGSGQDSAEGSSLPTAHCPLTTVIEVSDAGTGIAETDMPHVFEPFFGTFDTLHHSSGSFEYCKRGLGMGLAIVKKFVEMHGGTISVQPRTPRGTSFIIRLPAR